ncbi:carboxymuconolactone decarboxylase family protein [Streptomyces sulphureus]|uniref:carboxymuconolactone decarboxylase family protein n=1 Tax=Streptomyces sulphureus TaxID=47758 RepID=UPI00038107AE|nr:carboxymuconolactone decarboxylase family protein [Streptomyces sulphureus]
MQPQPRIKNPAAVLPGAYPAIQELIRASRQEGAASGTVLELAHLRASQINGCSYCVDLGARGMKKGGETDERLFAVAAWREAPYFTEAERAVLDLTEYATRLADHSGEAVPDAVWDEAARHFDEKELASIVLTIGLTNLFNHVNAATRQPAGATW